MDLKLKIIMWVAR